MTLTGSAYHFDEDAQIAFRVAFAGMFAGVSGVEGEQRLEWSDVHAAFVALYEQRLQEFLDAQGIETSEFADACHAALNDPRWQHTKNMANAVLAM